MLFFFSCLLVEKIKSFTQGDTGSEHRAKRGLAEQTDSCRDHALTHCSVCATFQDITPCLLFCLSLLVCSVCCDLLPCSLFFKCSYSLHSSRVC